MNDLVADAGVEITPVGARFTRSLSFEEWQALGPDWARIERALRFCIGDWLNYGEARYGEVYAQAAELTGLDPAYLANLKWITGRFELSRRREGIPLSVYQVLAPLPVEEQDGWLDRIEEEGLTRQELRQALKEQKMIASGGSVEPMSPREITESFEYLHAQWSELWFWLTEEGVAENDGDGQPLSLKERVQLYVDRRTS